MIDAHDVLDSIYQSTSSAFTDGYDTEKILLSPLIYEAIKKENEDYYGIGDGSFDRLFVYPVEVNDKVANYIVVLKEDKWN